MIRLFLLFILLCAFLQVEVTAQPWTSNQDSLTTTLLINPNDLLRTIPEWDAATTDGFTYRLNSGRYGYYGPQPTIYLDGIPIDLSYFNWQNLNMLPTSMDHINSISYRSNAQVHSQAVSPAGFLDLQSQPLDHGFSAYGSFALGNQIEDPGPWSYDTSRVTPNIDRRGPHYFSRLAYRGNNWYAKTQFSLRQYQPTNLNNNHRIGSYSYTDGVWHAVKNTLNSGLAEVGYTTSGWDFTGRALYGENEEYLFFQPFGMEVPTTSKYRQLALQGSYQMGPWLFKGRYVGHQQQLDYRINNKRYNFNWHQLNHTFSLSGRYEQPNLQLQAGTIIESSATDGLSMENWQALATFYGEGTTNVTDQHTLNAKASIDIAARETAPSLSVGSTHQLSDIWELSSEMVYDELLYYRQQSSTYWAQRGYRIFNQLDITQETPFSSRKNRSTSAGITNDISLNPSTTLSIGGGLIRHHALNIPWQIVSFGNLEDQNQGVYTNPETFSFTSEKGSRYTLELTFSQELSSKITHSFNLNGQYIFTGSTRYKMYWEQVPQENLNYSFKYTPFTDLSLSLNAFYQSSTTWREYQNIEGETYRSLQPQYRYKYGTFHTRTPSFFNVDITAKKWFWDRRLATTFSVRNLLNTEVRHHTLGLDQALQFVLTTSLSF